VKRKILAALLLAFFAILLALGITHFSFRDMMTTVDQLSTPNEKLSKLNSVFEEITTLDQQQRAEAIENPEKPYKYFLDQSGYLHLMIDSLQQLAWDSAQRRRLSPLRAMLDKRNELFVSYLKVRAELANNHEFSQQLDTLSTLLKESQKNTDSSVITTQRKTITTYLQDTTATAKADKSFIKKLFSKKKSKAAETPQVKVQEELNVTIDTVAIAKQGVDFNDIKKVMADLASDQRTQRRKLQRQELELIHANSIFINQLLNTLHEVEKEELQHIRTSNDHASQVVTQSISRMTIVMFAFFLGAAFLVYLIFIDISKSNYFKKQLEKARDQAEELSKIKQRFLANMSHEIRTPLQSIIGFAEQLKQQGDRQDSIDAIHSSSEHLLQIVNEVLDYSRISSGTFTLAKDRFNLIKLIKEVEAAMRIQADRKKLTFVLDTEKVSDHILIGDSFRLRQILYNLLGNAIKFTYSGFVRLTVTTLDEAAHVNVIFEITDSGIGMSDGELKKIFHQFEQANPDITKNFGGTGLGLTIVKALIDVQQGQLDVKSDPGIGSTFRVELRYEKAEDIVRTLPIETKEEQSASNARIIVVDDDALILKLCTLILKKNNIPFTTYNEPQSVLAEKADPSVTHIFIDIRMPQMNGVQLCKALRKVYGPKTQFIALTAHVLPDERDLLIKDGFNAVLTKPFHESEMLRAIGASPTALPEKPANNIPDFAVVRKMTMGDEALFQVVLQQFLEETDSDHVLLKECMKTGNQKMVREVVHKLAGRFGQMGIYPLAEKMREIEIELVEGKSLESLAERLHGILREVGTLLQNIRLTKIEHLN
jgi:signal transduction histidine kinase/FixJ family two-component response regulator